MRQKRPLLALIIVVSTLAALAVASPNGAVESVQFGRPSATNLLGHDGSHPESYSSAMAAAQYQAVRTGDIDPLLGQEAAMTARAQAATIGTAKGAFGQRWRELGPRPYHSTAGGGAGIVSGRVASLAVDPADKSGNSLYVGTAGGGLWLTRNGGKTYKPLWDARQDAAIGAIAIDSRNPKRIFIGTGEGALASLTVFRGSGVWRSLDGGKTFARIASNVKANVILRIQISERNVFVATDLGLWRSTDGGNSYQDAKLPTNEAATAPAIGQWANVVTDVQLHPDKPNQVTAAVGWQGGKTGGPGNGLYRSTKAGAPGSWTRMDITGIKAGSRTDDPFGRTSLAYATGEGQDHNVLWAVVQDPGLTRGKLKGDVANNATGAANTFGTVLNGVYRSGDDGATWHLKALAETFLSAPGTSLAVLAALGYVPGVQSWYNNWVLVSPRNADTVLVGLEEIYQTVAGANTPAGLASWKTIGRYTNYCAGITIPCAAAGDPSPYAGGTVHADQHAGAFTLDGTRLWEGNDGGVWVQDSPTGDFSNSKWRGTNETLGTTQPYYAAISRDGTVYAGFQDNGTAKISPNGEAKQVYGGDGGDVAVEPNNSDHAWEEYTFGDIRATSNGGSSWTSNAPTLTAAQFIAPFEMDPRNADHVVLGAREIMETISGVKTVCGGGVGGLLPVQQSVAPATCNWMQSFDLGTNDTLPNKPNFSSSAIDVHGPVVYAGYCGPCLPVRQGFYDEAPLTSGIATNRKPGCTPTTGRTDCWHHAKARGLPNRFITDVTIDPRNPSTVYVTLAGWQRRWIPPGKRARNAGRGHVFVSRNAGETFTDISKNLPDLPAESLEILGDRLFVGTHLGVYTISKGGSAWERLGAGLPNSPVLDINLNPQADTLIAATHGRGVWAVPVTTAKRGKAVSLSGGRSVNVGGVAVSGLSTAESPPALAPTAATEQRDALPEGPSTALFVSVLVASSLMLAARRRRQLVPVSIRSTDHLGGN